MKGNLSLSQFPDPASLCATLSFIIFCRFVEDESYLHVKFREKIACSNGIYSKQGSSTAVADVRDNALTEVYASASIE